MSRPGRPRPKPRPSGEARSAPERRASGGSIERIHGYRSGLAVLEARPADVLRVACVPSILKEVEALLGARAHEIGGVGVLDEHGLEKLAHTRQHEGLCLEARERRWASPDELASLLTRGRGGIALALDRVRNSYNIGAILRSAAFFGVDAVLLGAPAPHPGLDPNAIRVAEGGAERVVLARTTDLAETLGRLRTRDIRVIGTDGQATVSVLDYHVPRPAIVVMGNEREGVGARIRAQCDALVAIRGAGTVESLNVGVAAGIVIAAATHDRGA